MGLDALRKYFEEQDRLQKKLIDNWGKLSLDEKIALTKELLLHITSEIGEVLEAVGRWKACGIGNENVRRSQIIEELIDIFKFLVTIAEIWDFTPEDFDKEFWRKSEVVWQRYFQERNLNGKIVVLDLDGVIANHFPHLIKYYNEKRGTSYPEGESYLSPIVGTEEYYRIKHEYIEEGMFREVPVYEGAREFVKGLKKMGLKVVIVTGRPYKQYKRVYADTMEWLKKNGIPFDAIYWTKDKADLARSLGITPVAFIEDEKEQAADITRKGFKCILIDRPYNRDYNGVAIRAYSYDEILDYLRREIDEGTRD
jgi:uncharacterized HAD superfamily protein/NTP pyrophosphatase (non-canonical NTP hydrolase)